MAIRQGQWRTLGAACILLAAGMAVFATISGLLEDTVVLLTGGLAPAAAEASSVEHGLWWVLIYWGMFGGLILVSCYLAFVDFRYIRLQYALEKREIFGRTVGDAEFRDALLIKGQGKNGGESEEPPPRDSR